MPESELDKVNFSLAPDPPFNKNILTGRGDVEQKVYVGCAKWGRTEWVGKIYPLKTKERNFLDHYVKHFNSIELNATHYKLYGPAAIHKWADKAGDRDFKFCPKMHKGVTHKGKLDENKFLINEFVRAVTAFENHRGPIFVQLSERFSPKRKNELFDFLKSLPTDLQFFLEVRHAGWFDKEDFREEFFSTLKQINVGAVITDTAERRDCVHMYLTLPVTFIRFVGNNLHTTDFSRIDDWVGRIKGWLNSGLQQVFFFMHMQDEALSPELCVYLVEQLNKVCGLNLQPPKFLSPVP